MQIEKYSKLSRKEEESKGRNCESRKINKKNLRYSKTISR